MRSARLSSQKPGRHNILSTQVAENFLAASPLQAMMADARRRESQYEPARARSERSSEPIALISSTSSSSSSRRNRNSTNTCNIQAFLLTCAARPAGSRTEVAPRAWR